MPEDPDPRRAGRLIVVASDLGEHADMALRLLAVDLPPLIRELMSLALARNAHEGIFVELPANGGDVEAIAAATGADVVVAPLVAGAWPASCAGLACRVGPALFGLGCDDGDGRINELHSVVRRRTDFGVDDMTIDDLIRHAVSAAEGTRS